MNQYRFLVIMI